MRGVVHSCKRLIAMYRVSTTTVVPLMSEISDTSSAAPEIMGELEPRVLLSHWCEAFHCVQEILDIS